MKCLLFILSCALVLLFSAQHTYAGVTDTGIRDLQDVPIGMKVTLRFALTNNSKKSTRITDSQVFGDGFSANVDNCRTTLPAKKSCTYYITFDSSGTQVGPKTGYLTMKDALGNSYIYDLRARVIKPLQTPLGDKEAEDYFLARLPETQKRLDYLIKTKAITADERAKALANMNDYKDRVFKYTQKYFLECRPPFQDLLGMADSEYAYRIRYLANLFTAAIANPTATLEQITPEVTDYVPAKKKCKGTAEQILKCTRVVIDSRIAGIYSSIQQHNPTNPEPYNICADQGVASGKSYSNLVGILRHKATAARAQEILDIEDRVVMFIFQDLDEGY